MTEADLIQKIIAILEEIAPMQSHTFSETTPLMGTDRAIKSRVLVELLLEIEDMAEAELGIEFDWTSESAFSEKRSVFRTIGSLAHHLAQQAQAA